ncbi:TfoX/Sxy family protein [Agilicoccus flavus]|uniref:TfoX/Sxy family protein n=1 Tax=Agilicoccus flavus TaxID=2775968 RepID=UPI001CF6F1D4|nr:TfoX/Sxy family protein [Agilicoccus flavus]
MTFDEGLAQRIRHRLADRADITEKRMFGGLAFLVGGRMSVAATSGGLMVRIDPEDGAEYLRAPHVEPFEMRGAPLTGWLLVSEDGLGADDDLDRWIDVGVAYASTLPPPT